ncbi:MAG: pyridoxamine 5'-phosphate oxidase family protein [Clostridia bacterium]|nr:pyridoxamine 5'-phosphate oxidase family protein [Clostridia bacterium]
MENKDNKTKTIKFESLKEFANILEKNPMVISSVSEDLLPNACLVSDYFILDDKTIVISNNEMVKTPDNVKQNSNVCLLCFDSSYEGLRLTGKANYIESGKIYELVIQKFKNENTNPKGAITISIAQVEVFS